LEDLERDGRIVWKWIFKKSGGGGHGLDSYDSWKRHVAGSCKHGNEPWGSIKFLGFLDYLRLCQLLKKGSAQWSYFSFIEDSRTRSLNRAIVPVKQAPVLQLRTTQKFT
jgi:hypothetical protein